MECMRNKDFVDVECEFIYWNLVFNFGVLFVVSFCYEVDFVIWIVCDIYVRDLYGICVEWLDDFEGRFVV